MLQQIPLEAMIAKNVKRVICPNTHVAYGKLETVPIIEDIPYVSIICYEKTIKYQRKQLRTVQ